MRRDELVEQIIMIAILAGFLVHIFTGFNPEWLRITLYYVSPVVLLVIFYRRFRRMQEGFEVSRKMVDAQHQASGRNVLGQDGSTGGVQSPYPGVVLPGQANIDGTDSADDQT